jgi:hypothetical protein
VPDRRRHARAVDAQQRVAEGHDAHHLKAKAKRWRIAFRQTRARRGAALRAR